MRLWVCGTLLMLATAACGEDTATHAAGGSDTASQTGGAAECAFDAAGVTPIAGNRLMTFLSEVQAGRSDIIEAVSEDPFGCAYEALCQSTRAQVSEAEFRSSEAVAVSEMLSADTWEGTGPRVDMARELDDPETDGARTSRELIVTRFEHIDERTVVTDSAEYEQWRADLVRENGKWRVCAFALIDADAPAPVRP